MTVPLERGDPGSQVRLNVAELADPINQVARHAGAQIVAPHQMMNFGGTLGQKDDGLPGSVSCPNHNYLLALAELGLHWSRRIIDPSAFEIAEARHRKLSIFHSARDQHAAALESSAVRQGHPSVAPIQAEGLHRRPDGDFGAESLRLCHGVVGEVGP